MNWRTVCGVLLVSLAVVAVGVPDVYAQPNLIINGNVENDPEPDGFPNDWFHSSGVSYPNDNGPSAAGVKALQIDALSGASNADWRSSEAPAIPNAKYVWSFDYKFLQARRAGSVLICGFSMVVSSRARMCHFLMLPTSNNGRRRHVRLMRRHSPTEVTTRWEPTYLISGLPRITSAPEMVWCGSTTLPFGSFLSRRV